MIASGHTKVFKFILIKNKQQFKFSFSVLVVTFQIFNSHMWLATTLQSFVIELLSQQKVLLDDDALDRILSMFGVNHLLSLPLHQSILVVLVKKESFSLKSLI